MPGSSKGNFSSIRSTMELSTLSAVELFARGGLSKVPSPLKAFFEPLLKPNFLHLLIKSTRAPRIALYGSADSGKAELINTLKGKQGASIEEEINLFSAALDYDNENRFLEFVLVDRPHEKAESTVVEQAIKYLLDKKVDLLLGVMPIGKSTFTQHDINFLLLLKENYLKRFGLELPIIFVLNTNDPSKIDSNWDVPQELSTFLSSTYVSACTTWKDEKSRFSNIEELVSTIYETLPDLAKFGFATGTKLQPVRLIASRELIWATALLAGAICFIPAPGFDGVMLRSVQLHLVELIVRLGGRSADSEKKSSDFIHYLRPYGISKKFSLFNNQVAKIAGPLGLTINLLNSANYIGTTLAIGEAAIAYFIEGLAIEEAKDIFEKLDEETKEKFRKAFSRSRKERNPNEVFLTFRALGDEFNSNTKRSYQKKEQYDLASSGTSYIPIDILEDD